MATMRSRGLYELIAGEMQNVSIGIQQTNDKSEKVEQYRDNHQCRNERGYCAPNALCGRSTSRQEMSVRNCPFEQGCEDCETSLQLPVTKSR